LASDFLHDDAEGGESLHFLPPIFVVQSEQAGEHSNARWMWKTKRILWKRFDDCQCVVVLRLENCDENAANDGYHHRCLEIHHQLVARACQPTKTEKSLFVDPRAALLDTISRQNEALEMPIVPCLTRDATTSDDCHLD